MIKTIKIIDMRGRRWIIKRSKCGHYYAMHQGAQTFTRCLSASIGIVMGLSQKGVTALFRGKF